MGKSVSVTSHNAYYVNYRMIEPTRPEPDMPTCIHCLSAAENIEPFAHKTCATCADFPKPHLTRADKSTPARPKRGQPYTKLGCAER